MSNTRDIIEAATPGPWFSWQEDSDGALCDWIAVGVCHSEPGTESPRCICCLALMGDYDHGDERWSDSTVERWIADADFIAHFDPLHVSAMEDVCEAVDEWKAWRERNGIKAQSAHERHLLDTRDRLDELRGSDGADAA